MVFPAHSVMAQVTEQADRAVLAAAQAERLGALVRQIAGRSRFYTAKLDAAGVDAAAFRADGARLDEALTRLPMTTKAELVADQDANAPWGSLLTEPLDRYTRYNHTSGTTGRPLRWLDTNESWQWALECWKAVYRGAHVGPGDRIFFAFSFGPFFGFWTAYDAGAQLGAHCVPAGSMSTEQRLALMDVVRPTVLCCTPTYALRLAEVAREGGQHLRDSSVRVLIVAGEPGGNIPATRNRIEDAWGARVIDHHGLTEVGPVSFECWERPGGLHVNELEYIAEVLDPATLRPAADGEAGELVLTNLGRTASPVLRYRTGDIVVRRTGACACGRTLAWLDGGIRGRADDMVTIRGVNVYPSAIEAAVRRFQEVVEFRSTVGRNGALRSLSIEIEVTDPRSGDDVATRLSNHLREAIGLTVPVALAAPGSLPRFEMKARRFVIST